MEAAIRHRVLKIEKNMKGEIKYMGGCQNYGPFLGTLNI